MACNAIPFFVWTTGRLLPNHAIHPNPMRRNSSRMTSLNPTRRNPSRMTGRWGELESVLESEVPGLPANRAESKSSLLPSHRTHWRFRCRPRRQTTAQSLPRCLNIDGVGLGDPPAGDFFRGLAPEPPPYRLADTVDPVRILGPRGELPISNLEAKRSVDPQRSWH